MWIMIMSLPHGCFHDVPLAEIYKPVLKQTSYSSDLSNATSLYSQNWKYDPNNLTFNLLKTFGTMRPQKLKGLLENEFRQCMQTYQRYWEVSKQTGDTHKLCMFIQIYSSGTIWLLCYNITYLTLDLHKMQPMHWILCEKKDMEFSYILLSNEAQI
jgi:hypothetical protein